MSPVTRLRVGLMRMGVELLLLCYVIAAILMGHVLAPAIVATLVAVLRLLHLLAGYAGYRSIVSSVRKAADRG